MQKSELLAAKVQHISIADFNTIPIIEQYEKTAFQARNLARAAKIYDKMLNDKSCAIILCLAGSLFSAGLKKIVYDLTEPKTLTFINLITLARARA